MCVRLRCITFLLVVAPFVYVWSAFGSPWVHVCVYFQCACDSLAAQLRCTCVAPLVRIRVADVLPLFRPLFASFWGGGGGPERRGPLGQVIDMCLPFVAIGGVRPAILYLQFLNCCCVDLRRYAKLGVVGRAPFVVGMGGAGVEHHLREAILLV